MFARKIVISCAIAAAACALPAVGYADYAVVQVSPPAPVYEPVPPPREGYTWAPGYWRWEGDRQVWVSGHWAGDRAYLVYRDRDYRDRYYRDRDEEHHWWRRHHDND